MNEEQTEEQIQEQKPYSSKNWWKWFWVTIIFIAFLYIGAIIFANKRIADLPREDRVAITQKLIKKVKDKYPNIVTMTENLTENSKDEIESIILDKVEDVYAPVYSQIDNFSDFHYSVHGEYTELYAAIFGKVEEKLQERLFEPANFNEGMKDALKAINSETIEIIKNYSSNINLNVKKELDISGEESKFLMQEILAYTQKNMLSRYQDETFLGFRGLGLAGSEVSGVMIKVISAKLASIITKKVIVKAAVKGGTKLAGVAASAAAGGSAGVLCGPGAVICSPVGAVIGGIVGWFATDKIIVEVDQFLNEDEFKNDLKTMIDNEKEATKKTLNQVYIGSLKKVEENSIKKFDEIREKSINELIK